MKGFLVGFGLGVCVGILFAPMKGEDFRVVAAVRASEIADSARETYEQVQDTAAKTVNSLRNDQAVAHAATDV